jgi:hypothetical protein
MKIDEVTCRVMAKSCIWPSFYLSTSFIIIYHFPWYWINFYFSEFNTKIYFIHSFIFLSIQHLQKAKPLHMNSTFVVIDESESSSAAAASAAAASTASCVATASLTGSALPPGSWFFVVVRLRPRQAVSKSHHMSSVKRLWWHIGGILSWELWQRFPPPGVTWGVIGKWVELMWLKCGLAAGALESSDRSRSSTWWVMDWVDMSESRWVCNQTYWWRIVKNFYCLDFG